MTKYPIIYADFPWRYNSRANHKTRFRGGADGHYPLMSMDEVKAFPMNDIAAPDCALFLWCTFPYLLDQIKLFEHWGIRYRSVAFTWTKANPKALQAFKEFQRVQKHIDKDNFVDIMLALMEMIRFFGVGYYAKSNAEICLLGIRGKMKVKSNKQSSIIISKKREHSRKPDEARKKIVKLFGDQRRIELFARSRAAGWDAWGNEVQKFGREV